MKNQLNRSGWRSLAKANNWIAVTWPTDPPPKIVTGEQIWYRD
jgi:hypothetical protein